MMRFNYTLLLALVVCTYPLQAQTQKAIIPFSLGEATHKAIPHLRQVRLNQRALAALRAEAPQFLTLSIPLPTGEVIQTELLASGSISSKQLIKQTGGKVVQGVDKGIHYRTAKKESVSGGALSIFNLQNGLYQLSGMVEHAGKLYVLGPDSAGHTVIFPESEMPGKNPFKCHADEIPQQTPQSTQRGTGTPPSPQACANTVKFFVEVDYQAYADNNLSTIQTVAWINTVWNILGKVYFDEGVPIEVTETYINTAPDNYPFNTSFEALDAFGDTLLVRNTTADLAHYVSTKPSNLGGVAYLDVLCNPQTNFGFSNANVAYAQVPAYSWTINVIAHEIGHNMGSHHTQWCGWETSPGTFGMIDSCYTPEDAGSGSCYGGAPIPRFGTIMSYCHLTGAQGGGVDLALGFGLLPGAVILNSYQNANCLTPGEAIPNVTVVGLDTACVGERLTLTVTNVPNATYRWQGPNNFNSTQREPVIASFSANQVGAYNVVVTLGTCVTSPYTVNVVANCIGSAKVGNDIFCSRDVFGVRFNSAFTPTAGNQYQVELSNANGQFNLVPNIIGTLASTAVKGQISTTLPATVAAGNRYRIRVRSSAPVKIGAESADLIVVRARAVAPTTTGASRTTPGTLTLTAIPPTGAASVWFNDSLTATPLARGNTYTTPSIAATRKFWVESQPTNNQRIGEPDQGNYVGSFINNTARGMYFTVLAPMVLDSVRVFTGSAGTLAFNIKYKGTGRQAFFGTVPVASSGTAGQKVKVGAQLQPGSYVMNAEGSANIQSMYRILDQGNILPFPYTVNGLLAIDSATVSDSPLSAWYFFFDWRVKPLVCISPRVSVLATISACSPPPAPTATGISVCAGTSVSLSASAAPTGYAHRWFDRAIGGNNLPNGTAAVYNLTAAVTDTFWVALQNISVPSCSSARTRVIVTVQARPNNPTATTDSACPSRLVTLRVSGGVTAQIYEWFDRPTGGVALQSNTSSTYTYTPAAARDTLYVQIKNNVAPSCSSSRVPIQVKTRRLPPSRTVADVTRCGSGTVVFRSTPPTGLDTLHWLSTNGQLLARGNTFTTPTLTASTGYQVRVTTRGGCNSTNTATRAVINTIPTTPSLTFMSGILRSSNTGTHIWLLNGVVTAFTTNQITNPTLGSWKAISVLGTCAGDTSAAFVIVSVQDRARATAPRLYPNPTSDYLNLEGADAFTQFEIADVLGRKLVAGSVQHSLSVSTLPKGIYFLKLSAKNRTSTVLRFEKR